MPDTERNDLNVHLLRISIKSDKCMEAILGFLVFGSKFSYALDIVVSSVCGIENQKLTFCHSGCRSLSVSPRQIRLTRESRLDQRRSLTALLSISNCQLLCNEGSHTMHDHCKQDRGKGQHSKTCAGRDVYALAERVQ